VQQIERDCFSVAKRRSIYIYDVSISGFTRSSIYIYIYTYTHIYIYDISSLRVNNTTVLWPWTVKEQDKSSTAAADMKFL